MKLPEDRKKLVEDHLYLVDILAKKTRKGLPRYIDFEFEDLVGYGYIGLVDAGIKFDESRGWKFNTYANRRIKGAIIDGIRKMDWLSQSLRRKQEDVKKKEKEGTKLKKKEIIKKPISIDEIVNVEYETGRDIEDKKSNVNEQILMNQFLMRMLMHLEWKRYCSLYMRFIEGYKEKEIAEMLGVSPSRISQLTKDARMIMGRMLENEWKDCELAL